ncbi:hypothetical protein [Paenibacillus illinoisensis]|uniref:hypothetical protein n=1 Tax=Paenibacillus illinoisensis TaxID=59845 RepID=UPI00301BFA25
MSIQFPVQGKVKDVNALFIFAEQKQPIPVLGCFLGNIEFRIYPTYLRMSWYMAMENPKMLAFTLAG